MSCHALVAVVVAIAAHVLRVSANPTRLKHRVEANGLEVGCGVARPLQACGADFAAAEYVLVDEGRVLPQPIPVLLSQNLGACERSHKRLTALRVRRRLESAL